jgi:hypothetical protein
MWRGHFALFLFLPVGILPFVYSSGQQSRLQRALPNDPSGRTAPTARPTPADLQRLPRISDWTTSHVVFPQNGFARDFESLRREPRAAMRWREVEQREARSRIASWANPTNSDLRSFFFRAPITRSRFPIRQSPEPLHTDWNISLGAGSTAPAMFPAKYQFNTSATADCTNDFMVFPVNVGSTNGQPNIVAFNNLYSGGSNLFPTGLCGTRTIAGGKTDNRSLPTVLWSYNIHSINPGAIGGAVTTSPVLSQDGAKVAFVESATGNAAHFHVLAWKAGDGRQNNLQTVTSGVELTSPNGSAPTAGSGSFTDLQLGAATTGTDTISSPYIDYFNDTAYVGNDIGVLYRIKNVFCTTGSCGTAAPSLDASWGTGGVVATGCAGVLTGPVQDFPSLNVYVGCSNGKLYGFNSVGTPLANSPVAIGDGTATGDVADPPVVDPVNSLIYVVSGSGAGVNTGKGVLVQLPRDLSSSVVAVIGKNVGFSLHAPAFNDAYFTNATSSTWVLYAQAYDTTGTNLTFFGATFNASRIMNSTVPASNLLNYGTRLGEGTPLTEFKNGTTDWLFHAEVITPNNMGENNINTFPTALPDLATTSTPAGCTGITGMIVDNSSASAQASSVYFTCTGSNVAYKFTQNGLN